MRTLVSMLIAASTSGCGSVSPSPSSADAGPDASIADVAAESSPDAIAASEADVASVDSSFKGGSRLKARVRHALDAKSFLGFRDTELGFDCSPALDSAGTLRCVPDGARVVYSDSNCTARLVLRPRCSTEKYAREVDACSGRAATYGVGTPSMAFEYFESTTAGCRRGFIDRDEQLLTVDDPVDASSFASFDETLEPVGGGLLARVRTSADGARVVDGILDATSKRVCSMELDVGDSPTSGRCFPGPVPVTLGNAFADSGCSQKAAPFVCPDVGDFVATESLPGLACSTRTLAPRVDGVFHTIHQTEMGMGCYASPLTGTFYAADPTSPLPPVPTVSTVLTGSGKMHSLMWSSGGVTLTRAIPGFVDDKFVRCAPIRFADGSLRCVPADARLITEADADAVRFAGSDCMQKEIDENRAGICTSKSPTSLVQLGRDECGVGNASAFEYGALVAGGSDGWYIDPTSGVCTRWSNPDSVRLFGKAKPSSDYVLLTDTLE